VDHFAPNEYHKTTGFYLLWTYLADGDVDLVDWALYSPEPGQGLSKIDAENKVITTGQKLGGKVELRKPI
jgi:hypothetical protein